ncbi:efflux RND transporter periplasmic adaptor subunit [uncultured Psychrosphaera sp.]|uniref:efflux RND transporter periplasmic adaptor subunit n=1 Tax=uncultured Psychrosphaera sp. TaxID=1403522 RepID=UPI002633B3B1|nr:efflux RND transporter periplasmic adaptor subunit [uncultured Psychrosphaera sp.]
MRIKNHPALTPLKLAALGVFSTFIVSCGEAPAGAQGGMPPANVKVISATTQDVPFDIELPATLSGSKEVEVRARVGGILTSRNFDEGQAVTKGQSLFTIDIKPYQLAVAHAEALLDSAEATLSKAKKDVTRLSQLKNNKSISQSDFDSAQASVEVAAANVSKAKIELKQAKLNLDYAQVKSPVNGVMGREFVSEGTYVTGPALLLSQITQLDPIRVRFGLSEREQLAMRTDQAAGNLTLPKDGHWDASIKLQDGSVYPHAGSVNFSDIRINQYTGTSELQAVVANPEFSLRPGQFVRITLSGAVRKNAFLVPQRAVLDSGTGKFVYLATKNAKGMTVALPAPVQVGEWIKQEVDGEIQNYWVIRSGLKLDDQVIIDGMARIFFPGMPVAVADNSQAQ